MRPDSEIILWAFALIGLGGPLLLGLAGLVWPGRENAGSSARAGWRLILASTLTYALAFNLIFFVQELFLVLPKALVPGLDPILYHNNHGWTGDDPIAELLQGAGALAILMCGLIALAMIRRTHDATLRLLVIWLAFHGLFESLPQVPVGAIFAQNDVGRAMTWLGMGSVARMIAALAALAAMAIAGMALSRWLLEIAEAPMAGRGARMRFLFQVATLPAVLGTMLILLYRVPGSIDQVVIVPVAVAILGIGWVQANGWRVRDAPPRSSGIVTLGWPLVASMLLLLFFHLLLRPGIAF